MARKSKRIMCLLFSLFTIVLNVRVARAEAVPDILYGSATVADCVMSYYAMAGSAVANTDWINSLYDSLGSSFGTVYDFAENGMLTINQDGTWQATTALTEAIENSSAYTSLGLDTAFSVSSAEAAAGGGFAAASGASILSGALGGLGSTGVLPVLGGVTAAYWGGIAIGTIAAHLLGLYDKPISNGLPIDTLPNVLNSIPDGYSVATSSRRYSENSNMITNILSGQGYSVGYYNSNNTFYMAIIDSRGSTVTGKLIQVTGSNYNVYDNMPLSLSTATDQYSFSQSVANCFPTLSDYNNFLQGLRDGTVTPKDSKSPDMIGENGNLVGSYNNGGYSVPDLKPQIDPGVQSGVPLSMSDWLNFANSVKSNNSQTNPLPDNQSLFDNLLTAIKKALPNPSPNPDPNPNPNPDPNPDTYTPPVTTPVPDPDYDPVPDNPNQPDYESEKQNMTETIPDSVPTGAPWTTDGLLDKFPFCIPKDMIDMVKHFGSGARQAPYISWTFNPPNTPVDYTFNLDLSDYEDIATLVRLLELGLFIVGLAFATRYLIGAS